MGWEPRVYLELADSTQNGNTVLNTSVLQDGYCVGVSTIR